MIESSFKTIFCLAIKYLNYLIAFVVSWNVKMKNNKIRFMVFILIQSYLISPIQAESSFSSHSKYNSNFKKSKQRHFRPDPILEAKAVKMGYKKKTTIDPSLYRPLNQDSPQQNNNPNQKPLFKSDYLDTRYHGVVKKIYYDRYNDFFDNKASDYFFSNKSEENYRYRPHHKRKLPNLFETDSSDFDW